MPLQGELGQIGLADVLQTALAGSRGGTMTVTRGLERAVLQLGSEGVFLVEPEILEASDILAALHDRGELPPEATGAIATGKASAEDALESLVAGQKVPEERVREIVAAEVEDAVLTLMSWREGSFHFMEGSHTASERKGRVASHPVDLQRLLLRAADRVDERTALERVLGTHAVLFCRLDVQPPDGEPEERLPEIYDLLDGHATAGEIALRLGLPRFTTMRSIAALVEAGAARPATADELGAAVDERLRTQRLGLARDVALQWAVQHPDDAGGVRALVRVAQSRERPVEIATALTLLGTRLGEQGEWSAAMSAYQDALAQRPGDDAALRGLRRSAQEAGDTAVWASTSLRLGQATLDAGDAAGARATATEVLAALPQDIAARLLAARSCAQLKDREGLVQQAQALVDQLGGKASKRTEREAADFCRDAVALLAPERGDLLRTLRVLTDKSHGRQRRLVMAGAGVLLVVLAVVFLLPPSAQGLLEQAQAAENEGDKGRALELVERLLAEHPDAEVADDARLMRTRLSGTAPSAGAGTPAAAQRTKTELPALLEAFKALPDAKARAQVVAAAATFAPSARAAALPRVLVDALDTCVRALGVDARGKRDTLGMLHVMRDRREVPLPDIRSLLAKAEPARDPASLQGLQAALEALRPYLALANDDGVARRARELEDELEAYDRALQGHAPDHADLRRRLAWAEIEEAHATCRERGPGLLVAGRLAEADELYKDLAARIQAANADPELAGVREQVERKHVDDFVRARRAMIAEVFEGLKAARAAADAGDVEAALGIYTGLATKYDTAIRFEGLVKVPLQVESVPAGAEVSLDGTVLGAAPLRIEVPWGGPHTVSVAAAGFEPHVTVLDTSKDKPSARLVARMLPRMRWQAAVGGQVEARPVPVGDDLLVADRAGHALLLAGADGRILWSRNLGNLEGVRAQPALLDSTLALVFVDGRMAFLDARDGSVLAEHALARPLPELGLCALGETVAVATSTPAVVGMRLTGPAWTCPLPSDSATAGVVAAHGAFWVGTSGSRLLRIDPRTGSVQAVAVAGLADAIVGLLPLADGLVLTTRGGQVARLSTDGSTHWVASNLGELVGPAALAAGRVVAGDRRGGVVFLDGETGSPVHKALPGREAPAGLLAHGDTVAGALADGRLWIYDARALQPVSEAQLSQKGLGPPALLRDGGIAVPTREGSVVALPFVAAPRANGSSPPR
ncbi:MAG: PQQ-binding-like beta-propeller repeat protein [Planctomycetia bacterium]